jgi:hypothetical protein
MEFRLIPNMCLGKRAAAPGAINCLYRTRRPRVLQTLKTDGGKWVGTLSARYSSGSLVIRPLPRFFRFFEHVRQCNQRQPKNEGPGKQSVLSGPL